MLLIGQYWHVVHEPELLKIFDAALVLNNIVNLSSLLEWVWQLGHSAGQVNFSVPCTLWSWSDARRKTDLKRTPLQIHAGHVECSFSSNLGSQSCVWNIGTDIKPLSQRGSFIRLFLHQALICSVDIMYAALLFGFSIFLLLMNNNTGLLPLWLLIWQSNWLWLCNTVCLLLPAFTNLQWWVPCSGDVSYWSAAPCISNPSKKKKNIVIHIVENQWNTKLTSHFHCSCFKLIKPDWIYVRLVWVIISYRSL